MLVTSVNQNDFKFDINSKINCASINSNQFDIDENVSLDDESMVNKQIEEFCEYERIYNFGKIHIEQACNFLSGTPEGTGLLRESSSREAYTLSFVKNGKVQHIRLTNFLLEERMAKLGIETLLLPQDLLQTNMTIAGAQSNAKYDYQAIINLGRGVSANQLSFKAAKKNIPSNTIDLRVKNIDLDPLLPLTPYSKLYIIGHCHYGSEWVTSNENIRISADRLAQIIFRNAYKLTLKQNTHKLKISIFGCYSACDDGDQKSFAFRLSQALDRYGVQADIYARGGLVHTDVNNFRKLVDHAHHAPGKKFLFTTEKGVTTILPYQY